MMKLKFLVIFLVMLVLGTSVYGQSKELTAEQKQRLAELQKQREQIKKELDIKNQQVREEFEKSREQDRSVMEQFLKEAIVDIKFKGQVTDYDGNPVSNAVVSGYICVYDKKSDILYKPENFSVKTGKDGYFLIDGKGFKLVIENITKDGYESSSDYVFDYSEKTYQKARGETLVLDTGDPEQNIFQIRKRGTVDFLIHGDEIFYDFNAGENKSYYPLLLDTWYDNYGTKLDKKDSGNGVKIDSKDDPDRCLEISCVFNEDKSEFDLKFKTVRPNSGVFLTKDFSNKAPDSGYQSEVVYHGRVIADDNGNNIYIFVQGPEKKFYSRMEINVHTLPVGRINKASKVSVDCSIYTNPYGRCYLEYDQEAVVKENSFRESLYLYRSSLEEQARRNKEIFDVKEFKKMVDERYAGQNIERLDADRKILSAEEEKAAAAREEARLKAEGKWSDDPAERQRIRMKTIEDARARYKEQKEKDRQDYLKREEEIKQRKEANQKAKAEKAAQEQAK